MFAKTSLLFCCFCIQLFGTNVCVVPYGVMRNLDAIIRVSNYVRPNLGLQRARSLRSAASDKLIMPFLLAEWEFMRPSQSCKMAEGSSSSCTPRERAVSLLRVVQSLLEESTEIYFGLPRWPVKSRSATCAEKERLWELSKSRTSLSRLFNNIAVNSMNSIESHNCITQSFDTIKNWFLAISIQIWWGKLSQNLVNPPSKAVPNNFSHLAALRGPHKFSFRGKNRHN